MVSRPARPIRTLHLDDLALLVAESLRGFTHFVIVADCHIQAVRQMRCERVIPRAPVHYGVRGRAVLSRVHRYTTVCVVTPWCRGPGGPCGRTAPGWRGAS